MTPRRGSAAVRARARTPFDAHDVRAGNGNRSLSPARRIIAALAALIVAMAGFAVALIAFDGDARRPVDTAESPIAPIPKENGPIYYRVGGGEGPGWIESVRPDGSDRRIAFEGERARISQIAGSPDGSRIVYRNPIDDERGIYVANADGMDPVRLTDGVNDGWPSWSPDGARIVFSSTRHDLSAEPCTSSGDPDLVCPTDIYVMDSDGSNVTHLRTGPGPEYQPVWSPDGTMIAFTKTSETWIPTAVYVMNADGTEIRQISSSEGGSDSSPSWSPDGSQIAFRGFRYESTGIWIVEVDGSNERQVLGEDWYSVGAPVWSPDGMLIAFVGSPDGGEAALDDELYVMRSDGTDVTQLVDAPGHGVTEEVAWQPVVASSEGPVPTESPPPELADLNPRVTATIPVGAFPRAVAVGRDAVWATVDNANGGPEDHLLVEIDPATNQIVRSNPLPEAADVAFGDEALWVTSWDGEESVLLRVDLSTAEVIASIPLGWNADDVAFGFGAVWVTVTTDGASSAGEVLRIDPVTNDVVSRIPVATGWPRDVVVGEGSVWVYGHSKLEEHGWVASSLWRIDPTTNQVAATVLDQNGFLGDGGFLPNNVAVDDGWAWAADDRGNGVRIDAASGAVTTFRPGDGSTEPNGFGWPFVAYEGHVFFGLGTIKVLETELLEVVMSIPLESQVADAVLDPATGTLWIANYEDTVTRIDLH
jgi:Tol biopolymer transport system component